MIAVIFELVPAEGCQQQYLDIAATLAPDLASVEGFISVERFASLSTPGKLLSLSFWTSEEAVAKWRNTEHHRQAQGRGRAGIFADYRLRVASVSRDYGLHRREEAPADSQMFHL